MTAAEVRQLVESHIGGRWDKSNAHGVDLRSCLVVPHRVRLHLHLPARSAREKVREVWLVLEENPATKDGYKIVYDEHSSSFGLACGTTGETGRLSLVGLYGDFMNALEGM